jgi:hypothetical protein
VGAAALIALAGAAAAQQAQTYASPEAALEQGLGAYKAGDEAGAVPALAEAAAKGPPGARFYAEFYLARIYAEAAGGVANRAKAYMLFRKLADENLNVDPDDPERAPFVAKALIALADFARAGVREIDLPASPRRAIDYLNHAAVFFGDKEAQFELARAYLGDGAAGHDVKRGLHYLSVLTEESYPAAQALLAELLWRGRHVKKDEQRALALATMAVENAPPHERMWIEDTYASIWCATAQGQRREAEGFIARWRRLFARPPAEPADRLSGRELLPERRCANGEAVVIQRREKSGAVAVAAPPPAPPPVPAPAAAQPASPEAAPAMKGSTLSLSFRPAGGAEPPAKK